MSFGSKRTGGRSNLRRLVGLVGLGLMRGALAAAPEKVRVLILCTVNSARSQMSAGFLQSWDTGLAVFSAGTNPSARVNPFAIQAMLDVGVDASNGYPKRADQFVGQPF